MARSVALLPSSAPLACAMYACVLARARRRESSSWLRNRRSRCGCTSTSARQPTSVLDWPAPPVNLNWPFREPLVPTPVAVPARDLPDVGVDSGRLAPSPAMIHNLTSRLAVGNGVIVCGQQDDADFPEAAAQLASRLGWPL